MKADPALPPVSLRCAVLTISVPPLHRMTWTAGSAIQSLRTWRIR